MKPPVMMRLIITLTALALLASTAAEAGEVYGRATDPSYIGVGARPLGMGKAYVGLAEDSNAIFVNPAGLGKINDVLVSSMYSKLMDEVNYMVGSVTFPMTEGTVAIGYLNSTVPDIELYSVNEFGTPEAEGLANYSNYVAYLSYGVRLDDINPDVSLGASLKSLGKSFSGIEYDEGTGSGMNIDLGVLYQPNDWFTMGLTQQNALETTMKFVGGIEEAIPSTTKIGFNANTHGKNGFNKTSYKINIAAELDVDSKGERESTAHFGIEYWPVELLAIRAGVDQDATPDGVMSNFTGGVGLRLGNIEFDYAYHTYYDIPENATNYFSISVVGPFDSKKPRHPRSGFKAELHEPRDNMIIYGDSINLSGSVEDPRPGDRVEINGEDVALSEDGTFAAVIEMKSLGGKRLEIKAMDERGRKVEFKRDLFRLMSFRDVPQGFWAKAPIELLGTAGLVSGYPDGTFRPERTLTRAELATLIVKARGDEPVVPSEAVFKDVNSTHWASAYIMEAKKLGMINGYPDGTYQPNKKITRAEGIAVLARADGLTEDYDMWEAPFPDLSPRHWAATIISSAVKANLLNYLDGKELEASKGLTRAEAVEILSRTDLGREALAKALDMEQLDKFMAADEEIAAK